MGYYLKVRVTREVLSSTTLGVKTESLFSYPLKVGTYHLKEMELDIDFEIANIGEDYKTAVVRANGETIYVGNPNKLNYFAKKYEPRFLFFVHFDIVIEDYGDNSIDGYELDIHEVNYSRDTYDEHKKEKDYRLDVILHNKLYLCVIEKPLEIIAIDKTNMKVIVKVWNEEVEVSLDKPGEYNHSVQSGYNDSFEIRCDIVEITLKQK